MLMRAIRPMNLLNKGFVNKAYVQGCLGLLSHLARLYVEGAQAIMYDAPKIRFTFRSSQYWRNRLGFRI